jgi:large subunit ribosomal protein L15
MPLLRRIPKRGFSNFRHAISYVPVNVGALNRFVNGSRVDEHAMRAAGLVSGKQVPVKILGQGVVDKALTVVAHAFSSSARSKIESVGGTCELAGRPSNG